MPSASTSGVATSGLSAMASVTAFSQSVTEHDYISSTEDTECYRGSYDEQKSEAVVYMAT
jgi:hypothetical protein